MDIFNQDKFVYLTIFLMAFFIRLIPEIIIPSYPIGYETITYYAPALIPSQPSSGILFYDLLAQFLNANQPLTNTLRAGPLFYILMFLFAQFSGANSFLVLKIVGPLLYGTLAVSFLFFARRALKMEIKIAFLATLLMIFQIAALRESWDRFRTVLALVFFFVSLTVLKNKKSTRKWLTIAILGILTVLTRDYIGLFLLATVAGYSIYEKKERLPLLLTLLPTIILLFAIILPSYFDWIYLSNQPISPSNNYFGALQDSLLILIICYLPIIPLVLKGFQKNSLLTSMVIWLLISGFASVLFPWFTIPGYQRWLMLLVFPFSIYAFRGLSVLNFRRFKKPILAVYVSILLIIGLGYSTGLFSYVGQLPNSYVPIHLVQSSIPWDQIDDVKNVLSWIDDNSSLNSTLLTEERFLGWTRIYLQRDAIDITILPYGAGGSPFSVLDQADATSVYLMWYSDVIFDDFQVLYSKNNIALFEYVNN